MLEINPYSLRSNDSSQSTTAARPSMAIPQAQITPESCKYCKAVSAGKGYSAIHHCCLCDEFFLTPTSYDRHNKSVHGGKARELPTAPFECVDCKEGFYNETLFNTHLVQHGLIRQHTIDSAAKGVPTDPGTKKIFICPDCNRDFASKRLLKDHQCPNLYRCPSEKCHKTFRFLGGLVNHLESGSCKSGFSRHTINRLICAKDTKKLITVQDALNLLDGSDDSETDIGDEMSNLSLHSSWGVLTPIKDSNEVSFDGFSDEGRRFDNFDVTSLASDYSGFTPVSSESPAIVSPPIGQTQCYICYKVFRIAFDLMQHLASPIHAPKIYHCQLPFIGLEPPGKVKQFKTLSGLVAHIESGGCRGGKTTFEIAVSMLGRLAEEFGFPGMGGTIKSIGGLSHNHC